MTRNRASAKAAGAHFERVVADGLSAAMKDTRIDRKVKRGSLDAGDVANFRAHDQNITTEVKDRGGAFFAAEWVAEAAAERINDNGLAAIVVAKRRGVTDPMKQWCLMELGELIAIINGNRNHLEEEK